MLQPVAPCVPAALTRREGRILLSLELSSGALEDDVKMLKALTPPGRLLILLDLSKAPRPLEEIYQTMKKQGIHRYPESTYKALESLHRVGLLTKTYDDLRKRIVYSLATTV